MKLFEQIQQTRRENAWLDWEESIGLFRPGRYWITDRPFMMLLASVQILGAWFVWDVMDYAICTKTLTATAVAGLFFPAGVFCMAISYRRHAARCAAIRESARQNEEWR